MLKKSITYPDFNGNIQTDDFYFNLTKTELAELDIDAGGNLAAILQRMVEKKDGAAMAKFIKEIIVRAYGEKSDDGKYFDKGDDFALGKRFTRSNAFDVLFTEILTSEDGSAAEAFLYGVIPADVAAQARANTSPKLVVGDVVETENN